MTSGALFRRMLLWIVFVAFCGLTMAQVALLDLEIAGVGVFTFYGIGLLIAAVLGSGTFLRAAGSDTRGVERTIARVVLAYLLFEVFVVLPVALWLGTASFQAIMREMVVRFTWLLFPIVLALVGNERTRRLAGIVPVIAAACLVAWGLYVAATGGAGFYVEDGVTRFRVLYGGATLLFAWPFALAVSGATSRLYTAALLGVSLLGLGLTNHRSGMIAFAIAGVLCFVLSGRFMRVVPWIVPAGLAALVAGLLWGRQLGSLFSYTFTQLFEVGTGNGADRLMRWRLAWEFFRSRPFNDYVWSWRYYFVNLKYGYPPHNFMLEIAVFEGVAGLAFYAATFAVAIAGAWRWLRKDAQIRALVGYLVAYLVFCFANAGFYSMTNMALLVGAVAALAARAVQLAESERAEAAGSAAREGRASDP